MPIMWNIHTRTRNFCELCTPRAITPGVRVPHLLVPARNFGEFCTPVPQYPELLEVLQHFHTRTWNFWKFCKTVPYPYPESTNPTEHNLANFKFPFFSTHLSRICDKIVGNYEDRVFVFYFGNINIFSLFRRRRHVPPDHGLLSLPQHSLA